jgi:hypothetical protein
MISYLNLNFLQNDDDAKKRQKRGGKGMVKAKKKEAELEKRITLSIAPRGKKKAVTVVQGTSDITIMSPVFVSCF